MSSHMSRIYSRLDITFTYQTKNIGTYEESLYKEYVDGNINYYFKNIQRSGDNSKSCATEAEIKNTTDLLECDIIDII